MAKYTSLTQRCVATGELGVDLHHLISRGAFGSDHEANTLPLCRSCHQMVHQIGLVEFADKYPAVNYWLKNQGWKFSTHQGRWQAPKHCRKKSKLTQFED